MNRSPLHTGAVATILVAHTALLGWGAVLHSPTVDEVPHLAAGLSHWELGRFDLYRVNPPLVRLVAALPVLFARPQYDWKCYSRSPEGRCEFAVGRDFINANRDRVALLFALGRWACIPFSLLGAWICYRWASVLYGAGAGLVAMSLWAFCPMILAFGQQIIPDVGAASLGAAAGYLFWRWLRAGTWSTAAAAGLVLGLAELSKTTWIILFVLWPGLVLFWRLTTSPSRALAGLRWTVAQIAFIVLLALFVLNLGYGFEETFMRLRDYHFGSAALRPEAVSLDMPVGSNRFSNMWLGNTYIPVPRNFLQGIDFQMQDFDHKAWSYLRGEWRFGGWYHYYLYAALIKLPLGTGLIAFLAILVTLLPRRVFGIVGRTADEPEEYTWRDDVVLLVPAIAVFLLVSSETGFNHHFRYVLPAFAFGFIWISKAARYVGYVVPGSSIPRIQWTGTPLCRTVSMLAIAGLLSSSFSSLRVYPHSLSYFNELAGGPAMGHFHLGGSNIDWGQDLWLLKAWCEKHTDARPLYLEYDNPLVDPQIFGIEFIPIPPGPIRRHVHASHRKLGHDDDSFTSSEVTVGGAVVDSNLRHVKLQPGWYVISVNLLHERLGSYDYFRDLAPVDRIGYSMNVYWVKD